MSPCQTAVSGTSEPPAHEPVLDLHFRATPAAVAGVRAAIAGCLEDLGVRAPAADDVLVVASELCANAAVHGGHDAWVQLWAGSDGLHLRVSDNGFWTRARSGGLPPADAEAGRGLAIVDRLSKRVRIDRTAGRTVVNCRLRPAEGG